MRLNRGEQKYRFQLPLNCEPRASHCKSEQQNYLQGEEDRHRPAHHRNKLCNLQGHTFQPQHRKHGWHCEEDGTQQKRARDDRKQKEHAELHDKRQYASRQHRTNQMFHSKLIASEHHFLLHERKAKEEHHTGHQEYKECTEHFSLLG